MRYLDVWYHEYIIIKYDVSKISTSTRLVAQWYLWSRFRVSIATTLKFVMSVEVIVLFVKSFHHVGGR